jgi:dolichol-phosphate mannosyltransferase
MKISIVSPVYNSEKIVNELVNRITEEIENLTEDYEIILIDDHSQDNSWVEIKKIADQNKFVKGMKFSRNFGQHAAIKAGLEQVKGDCCIVMDCDLQDDPKYFKELFDKWKEGNDIVYTRKKSRSHSIFKNITAKLFNIVFNWLLDNRNVRASGEVGSFSLISRKVINEFGKYNDYQFHYIQVLRWLGFKTDSIFIEHNDRFEGRSTYTVNKLLKHAMVGIVFQTDKLLRVSIYIGFAFSILSIILSIILVFNYFIVGPQPGWTSLIVVILFATGLILLSIGVLGLYVGKMFEQVKNRPQYVIDENVNCDD